VTFGAGRRHDYKLVSGQIWSTIQAFRQIFLFLPKRLNLVSNPCILYAEDTKTTDLVTELKKAFPPHSTFSRRDLLQCFEHLKSDFDKSSLSWLVYTLQKEHVIRKVSRDTFEVCSDGVAVKPEYIPDLSDEAKSITAFLEARYPELTFAVWELRSFNDFINHLIARNFIIVEVEKLLADFVFEALNEEFEYKLLYKPDEKEISLYADNPTVIVQSLVSEAPIRGHGTTLEKMLVDLFANKIIGWIVSPSENDFIFEEAFSRYQINLASLQRYARRRNKEAVVKEFIERYHGLEVICIQRLIFGRAGCPRCLQDDLPRGFNSYEPACSPEASRG
jgi:hypothetical protein